MQRQPTGPPRRQVAVKPAPSRRAQTTKSVFCQFFSSTHSQTLSMMCQRLLLCVCTRMHTWIQQGSDLIHGGVRGDAEKSPEKCCTACKKTPGCKFWSYGYASWMHPKRYACWVKSSMHGWQRQSDRTSGTVQLKKDGTCPKKEDLPLGACQSYNFEPGIDYQGSDLVKAMQTKGDWSYHHTTDEHCCHLCKKTPGCKYWTHGLHKPSGKWTCWLKSSPHGYQVQGEGDSGQSKYGARTSGSLVQNADGSFKKAATSGLPKK